MPLSLALALVQAQPASVAAPVTGCLAQAGAVDGSGATLPASIAGTTLKKVGDIERLAKRAKGNVVVIEGGDFTGWNFQQEQLANICFKGSKLTNSNWNGVTAGGIGFLSSDLTGAKMVGAVLRGALFRSATLANVDATRADFSGGQLDGGWSGSLAGWKIDGANFSSFKFRCGVTEADGCPFDRQGISAVGADFSGAVFQGFSFWGATLTNAKFDGAEFGLEDIAQVETAPPPMIVVRRGARRIGVPGALIPALARLLPASPAAPAAEPDAAPASPPKRPRRISPRRVVRKSAITSAKMLFVSGSLPIAPEIVTDPAWPQLARIVAGLAPSYLLVSTGADRRISARGKAIGEDGATCTIDTGPLPGRADGTYFAPPARNPTGGTPAIVIAGDSAKIASEQAGATGPARIVICTAPSPFGAMRRVPIDDLTFEALWSGAARAPG